MTRFLLDTNILSDRVRNPRGRVADHIAAVGDGAVCTSIIVAAELRFGAAKRASERLTRQVERILAVIEIQPFDAPSDSAYARLRVQFEAAGSPIGGNDMLIAAQALATDCAIVTDNEREFERVSGLRVENSLRRCGQKPPKPARDAPGTASRSPGLADVHQRLAPRRRPTGIIPTWGEGGLAARRSGGGDGPAAGAQGAAEAPEAHQHQRPGGRLRRGGDVGDVHGRGLKCVIKCVIIELVVIDTSNESRGTFISSIILTAAKIKNASVIGRTAS